MNKYCYQVKFPYLKLKENNAYAHAKIEKYGFSMYLPENENADDSALEVYWAKGIVLKPDCSIAKWLKSDIEKIYKSEKDKADSKWLKEIQESGYEFDADGKVIENEHFLKGLHVQLCISASEPLHGKLFINMGGLVEFYDTTTLDECVPEIISELKAEEVIYKKILEE